MCKTFKNKFMSSNQNRKNPTMPSYHLTEIEKENTRQKKMSSKNNSLC